MSSRQIVFSNPAFRYFPNTIFTFNCLLLVQSGSSCFQLTVLHHILLFTSKGGPYLDMMIFELLTAFQVKFKHESAVAAT